MIGDKSDYRIRQNHTQNFHCLRCTYKKCCECCPIGRKEKGEPI